ncbi:hypothetical protein ACFL17_10680 [Pseudomonadota bacterium]
MFEAILLYGLALCILFTMWQQVKGKSLAVLIDESHHLHQRVGEVYAKHPAGGTWGKYQKWMHETSGTHSSS